MKRFAAFIMMCVLLLHLPVIAEEAKDLTASCEIKVASHAYTAKRVFDRDWDTYWSGENAGKKITIKSPEPIYGLYICWIDNPWDWTIEEKIGSQWQKTEFEPSSFMHAYYPLNGAKELRLYPTGKRKKWFGISEIFVLGEGEIPAYVQQWKAPGDSCDLMLVHAHPDDEVLFFGGLLPTYAGERQLNVVTCVLTPSTRNRTSELLNSLWTVGLTNYPVIGPFHDRYSNSLDKAFKEYGKTKTRRYAVELLRTYRPQVVVTHDINGEYGHGMHRLAANIMQYAFDAANDITKFSDAGQEFGPWQASKLYLHLYKDNQIVLDWDQPLSRFDGKTGFEIAQLGYEHHLSQHRYYQFKVEPKDSNYSSYHFGLANSTVGEDLLKNDFMENIK